MARAWLITGEGIPNLITLGEIEPDARRWLRRQVEAELAEKAMILPLTEERLLKLIEHSSAGGVRLQTIRED